MDTLELLLTVLDSVLALFVFFPSVCLYWRGSWDLIGYYILPGKEPLNHFVHTAVGCCSFFNYFIIPFVDKRLSRENKVLYVLVTRALLAWQGILYMFLWRGFWSLGDYYLTRRWNWAMLYLAIDLLFMSVMRVGRATMWPPFMIAMDTSPTVLVADNRFNVPPNKPLLYALDSFFSAIVVTGMAIFSWRCVWCIWDDLLFPKDPIMSAVVNFSAGVAGSTVLLLSQRALGRVSVHLEKSGRLTAKYAWEGTLYIVVFVVLSSLWRGGWNLNVEYIFKDPMIGGWVNHLCGACLFLVLRIYSLVGAWGVGTDGTDPDGQAFFPIHYLRVFFHDKLQRRKESKAKKVKEEDKGSIVLLNTLSSNGTTDMVDGYVSAPDYFVSPSISQGGYPYDSDIAPARMPDDELAEESYRKNLLADGTKNPSVPKPKFLNVKYEDPWEVRLPPQKSDQAQPLTATKKSKSNKNFF